MKLLDLFEGDKSASANDIYAWVYELHTRDEDFVDGDLMDRIYTYATYTLETMRVSDIDEDQYQLYGDEYDYADKIKAGSSIPPIVVGEYQPNTYEIIDGTHRHAAAVLAGVATIPVWVGRYSSIQSLDEAERAFHGSSNNHMPFSPTHTGDNSTMFGAYKTTRVGIFFTDNNSFADMYGNDVEEYELDISATATDIPNLAFSYAQTIDALGDDRDIWIEAMNVAHGHSLPWEAFEDELGMGFVAYLKTQGFDSARFSESNLDDNDTDVESVTTVVFDPKDVKRVNRDPQMGLFTVNETFFSKNLDVLMPVVKVLMKTAARPLIYKAWKQSKNGVLALAAIKKLHDAGDRNPFDTLLRLTDLDVPEQFVKRLAWDAGLGEVLGIQKPHLMPMGPTTTSLLDSQDETMLVYHLTHHKFISDIMKTGLVAQIGPNSASLGETEKEVHVFFDMDSLEDALANWDMTWHDDDNEQLDALVLEVPRVWVHSPWQATPHSGSGTVNRSIPPTMIKKVIPNI